MVSLVVVGVISRTIALGRIPGINGDEAWYGVNAHLLLDGEQAFLRTGIGNIVSPLHSGLLLPLERLAGPSFVLLRLPSVFWGCLAIVLAYPLLVRTIGTRAAVITTGILALSPAAVSQARFGWDPSATIVLSLLAVAFAIARRPSLTVASFLLALVAHTTNIFLAPVLASQWGPALLGWYQRSTARLRIVMLILIAAVLLLAFPFGLNFARNAAHAGFLPSIELVTERLTAPSAWYSLWLGVVSLFSGVTTAMIAGLPPAALQIGANVIISLVLAIAFMVAWRGGYQTPAWRAGWFGAGLVASIVSFHVVAGQRGLEAGTERYAMFLVVPLSLLAASGLASLGRTGIATALALYGTLVAVLTFGYFKPLVSQGGHGHSTYRTGAVEPKLAAFEFVKAHSRDAEVVALFAEDWWLYWPTRYLAWHDRRLHVEMLGGYERWLVPPGGRPRPYEQAPDRVYAVVFAGGEYWDALRGQATTLFSAADPLGRPIVHVMLVPPDAYAHLGVHLPWQSRN
jgi:hypothetical protein